MSLHVPTSTTGVPSIQSLGEMAHRALRMLGIQSDSAAFKTAMQGIQRGVSKVNLQHTLDFTIRKDTDETLVLNEPEYDLSSEAFAVYEAFLVDDSEEPEVTVPLRFIDYDQYVRVYSGGGTGTPGHWTVRDAHADRKIILIQAPNQAAVDKYKLRTYYHERIERPPLNDENIEIAGPIELSEVLITYAQAHLLFTYERDNPAAWRFKEAEAQKMLADFKGSRNRTTPGISQIRVEGFGPVIRRGRRSVIRWGG